MSTPAYAYGRLLGGLQVAARRFMEQVAQGFSDALSASEALTPDDRLEGREIARERAYARRIAAERSAALRFEQRYAEKVWQELGLPGRLR